MLDNVGLIVPFKKNFLFTDQAVAYGTQYYYYSTTVLLRATQ